MQIHHAVEDIYRRNANAFDDPAHLVAALSDYVDTDGSGAGEIRLIVDAVKLGSFQRLQEVAAIGASPHAAIMETATVLARQRATDQDRSAWACAVLAFAIGLVNDADVQTYRARWELPTALPRTPPPDGPPAQAPPTQAPPVPQPTAVLTPPVLPQQTQAPAWTPAATYQTAVPPHPRSGGGWGWIVGIGGVLAVVLAGVVALLVLRPWDDTPARETTEEPPGVRTPEVGSCHALSQADISANSDPKPAVACDDAAATTITTDVVTIPDGVDRTDTEALWDAIGPECARTTLSFLGGNAEAFARSAYYVPFFAPTPEEEDAGADWARCDLALFAGGGTKSLPVLESSIDQLPLADEVALCAEDEAGGYNRTTCDLPHAYRVTSSVYYDGEYPTSDELTDFGTSNCDDGSGNYAYPDLPDEAFWTAGATYVVCYYTGDG